MKDDGTFWRPSWEHILAMWMFIAVFGYTWVFRGEPQRTDPKSLHSENVLFTVGIALFVLGLLITVFWWLLPRRRDK
jgi:uncharacterized membrane protein